MLTTTLNTIKANRPCRAGWVKLLRGLDKTRADDEPLPYARILEINGLADALWACTVEPGYAREWRLFSVACARDASRFTNDWRVIYAINIAERFAHGMASAAQAENAAAYNAAANAVAARAASAAAYYPAADAARAAYYAANAAAAAADAAADAAYYPAADAAYNAAANAVAAHAAYDAAAYYPAVAAYAAAYAAADAADAARKRQGELFLQIVI